MCPYDTLKCQILILMLKKFKSLQNLGNMNKMLKTLYIYDTNSDGGLNIYLLVCQSPVILIYKCLL